jgi:hypothetical protein
MLAVIQKSNQVSSLQGQLIATQDRSLRAERRSDELEAPNRDAQSAGAATESGIRGSRGGCHTPNYNSRSAKMSLFAVVRTGYRAVELITSAR